MALQQDAQFVAQAIYPGLHLRGFSGTFDELSLAHRQQECSADNRPMVTASIVPTITKFVSTTTPPETTTITVTERYTMSTPDVKTERLLADALHKADKINKKLKMGGFAFVGVVFTAVSGYLLRRAGFLAF
ncbi:hypothetical protein H2200_012243 [Cladophialophora chaetospira]|uniref:Uncharacterized protein n=1 Tax=Cladophialophora chaetospira TaxID=386627 RepID=A0AA38WYG7_9EURO|nr:hypothetical protein H2200_012243 [Cladophialophora chaetospira]